MIGAILNIIITASIAQASLVLAIIYIIGCVVINIYWQMEKDNKIN